jgi:hypothetical protein
MGCRSMRAFADFGRKEWSICQVFARIFSAFGPKTMVSARSGADKHLLSRRLCKIHPSLDGAEEISSRGGTEFAPTTA